MPGKACLKILYQKFAMILYTKFEIKLLSGLFWLNVKPKELIDANQPAKIKAVANC